MKWKEEKGQLVREFEFSDFMEVIDVVNQIADLTEMAQHHPDLLIHSYNKLKIMIYTHSEDRITEKDYQLAEKIDKLIKAK
jgi:4a-hydroxytetrahydrobiopterin dehydratase